MLTATDKVNAVCEAAKILQTQTQTQTQTPGPRFPGAVVVADGVGAAAAKVPLLSRVTVKALPPRRPRRSCGGVRGDACEG